MQEPSSLSAIIYESPTKAVVLIDIPTSLSAPPHLVPRCLRQPLETPYALAEPKAQTTVNQELLHVHIRLRASLLAALEDICRNHKGPYYHHRVRDADDAKLSEELDFYANTPFLQSLTALEEPMTLYDSSTTFSDISDIFSLPIISHPVNWTVLTFSHPHPPKTFHIPPNSSLLLSKFQTSATTFATFAKGLGRFHFILLDPPWPNRSAARSSAYETLSRFDIKDLLKLPIRSALFRPRDSGGGGGLVGVWITNKPKFRKYVLETLFPSWGLEMVGEWVWLKITTAGEPMFDLESSMRKPYEVLLFGRKTVGYKKRKRQELAVGSGAGMPITTSDSVMTEPLIAIPAKTILAVPDRHSRKPCIKELIQPYLPLPYRACEIFGRNLTEGWLTWGDEALKFNWEGYWKEKTNIDHR